MQRASRLPRRLHPSNTAFLENPMATPPPPSETRTRRTPNRRSSTALSKARDRLRGVVREDSDDELGDDDIPWEWIRDGDGDIVGARLGGFEVRAGDCVLIKGEGLKGEAYVGIACEFEDEEDGDDDVEGMQCRVMWFSTESEVRAGAKKRRDNLPVRWCCCCGAGCADE